MTGTTHEMAARMLDELKLGLPEAGVLLGTGGAPIHPTTIGRWIRKGAKTPDGRKVKLEAVRIGSKWVTTKEAVARFVAALTPAGSVSVEPPARTPAERNRATSRAAALEAMGA